MKDASGNRGVFFVFSLPLFLEKKWSKKWRTLKERDCAGETEVVRGQVRLSNLEK
jgi:hypothetical protein